MEKASNIISHLKKRPYLKNLQQVDCYNQLLSLLPKNLRNNTSFLYQKNDTLFFVLNHPGIKMEFNYKSNLIKSILKNLIEVHPECIFMKTSHIKAFVTNKTAIKNLNSRKIKKIKYKEKSNGKFKNCAKNRELYNILEKIRTHIKKNNSHEFS